MLAKKLEALEKCLRGNAPMLVAYSGGVDSSYLLAAAHRLLGSDVTAVIADSPSLPRRALVRAQDFARSLGVELETLATQEMADANYTSNPVNRCYFCKAELFRQMDALAIRRGRRSLAYGENADDATQIRPGMLAAHQFSVIAPLKLAGLTKMEIRELSRDLSLPMADEPAQPCLSSRIPYGARVTMEALQMIEQAEDFVRSFGFKIFRVRHLGTELARVQIAPAEMPAFEDVSDLLVSGLQSIGYGSVEIDPNGYQGAGMS